MNREVHVRFWERLRVKVPRATRQKAKYSLQMFSAVHPTSDIDRFRAKIMIYAQND
jgi:hypothetical protein